MKLGVRSACDAGQQITVTDGTSLSIKGSDAVGVAVCLPSSALWPDDHQAGSTSDWRRSSAEADRVAGLAPAVSCLPRAALYRDVGRVH
jgi:hypothetical protein